jgi:hypothetical protein
MLPNCAGMRAVAHTLAFTYKTHWCYASLGVGAEV